MKEKRKKIGKIWKKIVKRFGIYGRKISGIVKSFEKIRKKNEYNSEMIWKIWKKIVKRYEKYGRKK